MDISRITGRILTPRQAVSYFLMLYCDTDYLKYLDYDGLDWVDWGWINRN